MELFWFKLIVGVLAKVGKGREESIREQNMFKKIKLDKKLSPYI